MSSIRSTRRRNRSAEMYKNIQRSPSKIKTNDCEEILQQTDCLKKDMVREVVMSGFHKFIKCEFDVEGKERSGRPKVSEDAELEALFQPNAKRT